MSKEIELAKSWFVLSQILIILGGFFFATAGISWQLADNNKIEAIRSSTELNKYVLEIIGNFDEIDAEVYPIWFNILNSSLNVQKDRINTLTWFGLFHAKSFFVYNFFGILFSILGIIFFNVGRRKLKEVP